MEHRAGIPLGIGQTGDHFFPGSNGNGERYVRVWTPEAARGIVQIAHGMSEHSLRYQDLAAALMARGYAVWVQDHAGHGYSAAPGELGFMGESGGWAAMLADMAVVMRAAKAAHPGVPYFLLGHSMGSFLSRCFAMEHGGEMRGLILSGTAMYNPALPLGLRLSGAIARSRGPMRRSPILERMAIGAFNAKFGKPGGYEWLSRDPEAVSRFCADPLCGAAFTAAGYRDLFTLMYRGTRRGWADALPKELPVLLLSGGDDPVGSFGRALPVIERELRETGLRDVVAVTFPGGRHEMFNETNRNEAMACVMDWLENHILEKEARNV